KEEFIKILSALWEEIFNTPEIVQSVAGEKLRVKFRFSDLNISMYIDLTGETPHFFWSEDGEEPFDVEMILSSQTSHLFWMEKLNVPLSIASRKIIAKGSVQKALKLLPALKPAFALYPQTLKKMGREDLLKEATTQKRKKRLHLFGRHTKRGYRLEVIPSFPLELNEEADKIQPPVLHNKPMNIRPQDLLHMMYLIRAFERHLSQAFKEGRLPTEAIHLSIGQEAVAAGVCMNLRDSDYLNTTHRGHGHIIAKGADINKMMAELYGKREGLCKGKGGSMHVTDGSKGILGANGIVGAGYLLALGAGFTIKHHKKSDDVSVVIAGDGSVNQGMFHEAMNMIALFELPVLVIVENNRYGEFTSIERHSAETELHKRARAYTLEAHVLDGNDAQTVYKEVGKIIEHIRRDGKPRFVELLTYRLHGHMEGEPELYRDSKEKEEFLHKDPIHILEQDLINALQMTKKDLDKLKLEAERVITEAVAFAEQAAEPPADDLTKDVYAPESKNCFEGDFVLDKAVSEMSYAQAVNSALAEEMERDERVFLWGEDVSLGGYFNVTEGLVDRFGPKRIIDTPISENAIVGGAVGAAMTGMRPVAEILFADFLTCAMDPILNQAAKLRYMTGGQVFVPLTIRTPVGSGIGMAAQHSQAMERFFFGIPGLIVIAPSDAFTAKGLLKSAIRSNNPVLFIEHKLLYADAGPINPDEYTLPIGKARVVKKGEDLSIVTYLLGVGIARQTAKILAAEGIDAEIIDLLSLYPLDVKTVLESVKKTGRLVTLEEEPFTGSIGSEVISCVALAGLALLKKPPLKIASPENPIAYAKNLENAMTPSPEEVAKMIKEKFF
ncbi:MAG TPA: hypothetical protein EYP36_12055, partial [Calditrichaeota bacterium]|nr:hypothetical protein [Calditrichota bacterium]